MSSSRDVSLWYADLKPFSGSDGLAPPFMVADSAMHEAGHAVVGAVLYPPGTVVFATLEPLLDYDATCSGFVRVKGGPIDRGEFSAHGVFCYAGVAAEFPSFNLQDGLPDMDFSEPVDVEEIPGSSEAEDVFCELWERSEDDRRRLPGADHWQLDWWLSAHRLVNQHLNSVQEVARRLYEDGFVAGPRIEEILRGSRRCLK